MTGCPAHIAAYVEILGPELAVDFFLAFGGSEVYLSDRPRSSMLLELTGPEKAAILAKVLGHGYVRIPIPKPWIAEVLIGQGLSKAAIARQLHVDQTTVRRWLSGSSEKNQPSLF
ncbi:hypothetical protein [Roseibium sp.]|uniref:hypothetical protein n=1 Tax=Roseibium sp. TaxID=1936156 RepID=UPI003A96F23F